MKKFIAFVALSLCLIASVAMLGCGSSTSTDTTTTTATTTTLTTGAAAGESAASAVKDTMGIASTATTVGGMTGVTPKASSVSGSKALASPPAPPAAFFNPLPGDGWITMDGFVSGETAHIQFVSTGGTTLTASIISTKKIASLPGFDWTSMISGFNFSTFADAVISWLNNPTDWDPASASKITAFYGGSKYTALSSLWDYITWSYIAGNPSTESAVLGAWMYKKGYPPLASYPKIATPEATGNDRFGGQNVHVTGTHPNGETIDLHQSVSVDAYGMPASSIGSGTITRGDGVTMEITNTLTFTSGTMSSGNMDVRIGAPQNMHIVMVMQASGAASGEVYSTGGATETLIGSLVIFATKDADGHSGYFLDAATSTKQYF